MAFSNFSKFSKTAWLSSLSPPISDTIRPGTRHELIGAEAGPQFDQASPTGNSKLRRNLLKISGNHLLILMYPGKLIRTDSMRGTKNLASHPLGKSNFIHFSIIKSNQRPTVFGISSGYTFTGKNVLSDVRHRPLKLSFPASQKYGRNSSKISCVASAFFESKKLFFSQFV